MKKIAVLLAVCLAVSCIFVGCTPKEKKIENEVESAIETAVDAVKAEAEKIISDIDAEGKYVLEAIKEDEKTLKYEFTVAEEGVEADVAEIEEKVANLEDEVGQRLTALKDAGVKDAQILVRFIDKEGKELYSKIFK